MIHLAFAEKAPVDARWPTFVHGEDATARPEPLRPRLVPSLSVRGSSARAQQRVEATPFVETAWQMSLINTEAFAITAVTTEIVKMLTRRALVQRIGIRR